MLDELEHEEEQRGLIFAGMLVKHCSYRSCDLLLFTVVTHNGLCTSSTSWKCYKKNYEYCASHVQLYFSSTLHCCFLHSLSSATPQFLQTTIWVSSHWPSCSIPKPFFSGQSTTWFSLPSSLNLISVLFNLSKFQMKYWWNFIF